MFMNKTFQRIFQFCEVFIDGEGRQTRGGLSWAPCFCLGIRGSHQLRGRSVQCDPGGREMSAAGNEQGAAGAGRADRAPGAGCGRSEGRGAAEGGGRGATPDRGCVGGGGCRCRLRHFRLRGSADRSRQSAPAGWNLRPYPSNLPLGETQHLYTLINIH